MELVMKTKEEILEILNGLKQDIKATYKVRELGLFGSVVRDEQKQFSDIDILVDFDENASLFDLIGLNRFLEEKLDEKVDVISKRSLRKEISDSVLKETISL